MDDRTKDKLTGLRWVGPAIRWVLATRAWRVYEHLEERHWARLGAAITFISFLALFPVIALGASIGFTLLTQDRMTAIEKWFADQVPGISDAVDLQSLFDNAATIGLVALALLLPTGVSWVDELRGCLRAVWDLPDPPENPLLRKAKDLGVLAGLGGVMLASLAASALALTLVRHTARSVGFSGWAGGALLQLAAHVVAVGVTAVLMVYLLVWLPGVRPPRRDTVVACLMGAVGFELLKLLLSGYLTSVAAKNMYGAFGVPIALLIWINLMAKLLLFCCAWTATGLSEERRADADALDQPEPAGAARPPAPPAGAEAAESSGEPPAPVPPGEGRAAAADRSASASPPGADRPRT